MTNDEVMPKNVAKLRCEACSFTCSKLSNWNIHVSSTKHKKNDALTTSLFTCNCGKEYKYRQGLWAHKQKCLVTPIDNAIREPANTAPTFTAEVVLAIVQQNKELQHLLIDQNNKFMEKIAELASVAHNPVTSEK